MKYEKSTATVVAAGLPALTANFSTNKPDNVRVGDAVQEAKLRMLEWPNPVEFVNNMYGCHPGEESDYFEFVFGHVEEPELKLLTA